MTVPCEWQDAKYVSLADVNRRLDGATLRERRAVLDFIRTAVRKIRPAVDDEWLYDTAASYLLACISQPSNHVDDDDDSIHSPFEAASELTSWFDWYVARDGRPASIRRLTDQIVSAFKNGDRFVRNCIETGFLEHVLEAPRNRPYFVQWKHDPILVESYTEALRWGVAHTRKHAP